MTSENSPQLEAKFNSAVAKLTRIDEARKISHYARMIYAFDTWRNALRNWRSEMDERFADDERKEANKHEGIIDTEITRYQRILRNGNVKRPTNNNYQNLNAYELYLGRLEHKYGMGLPDKKDMKFLMEQMARG